MDLNIKRIFDEIGRPDIWLNQVPNNNYGKLVKQNLKDQFLQDWSSKLDQFSKGITYRIFKDNINLGKYILKLPKDLFINFITFGFEK